MLTLVARAPVIAIYGSSFPVWLFAAIGGVLFAVLLRQVLIVAGLHRKLPLAPLFYSAVTLLAAVLGYVIWIGGYRG